MRGLLLILVKLIPQFVKILFYKITGSIGGNFKISNGSLIITKEIIVGENVYIGRNVLIIADKVVIGDRVRIEKNTFIKARKSFYIGKDSYIEEANTIGGMQTPESSIEIGDRVGIFPRCYINTTKKVTIKNDVGIGGESLIFTHGTWQNVLEGYPFSFGEVVLEKNVWLPWRVFILPNVVIGENTTIGSASVVSNNIPANCFAAGTPCKVIKENNRKNLSLSDRFIIISNILDDLISYFETFYSINFSRTKMEDAILLKSEKISIFYTQNQNNILEEYDIVLLDFQVSKIEKKWWSLIDYKAHYPDDPMKLKVLNFLSQYGIRFDYI